MTEQELIEALADAEHASWARWMNYLFSKCTVDTLGRMHIPSEFVDRWGRQALTTYADLVEQEKESDRAEVRKILPLIQAAQEEQTAQLGELLTKEYECAGLLYRAMDQLNVHHRDVHHHGGENMPSDATVIAGYRAWGMHLHIRPKVRDLLQGAAGQPSVSNGVGQAEVPELTESDPVVD